MISFDIQLDVQLTLLSKNINILKSVLKLEQSVVI